MSVTTAELVQGIVAAAVLRAADELGWDEIARAVAVEVERPGDPAHGDYATNIAMKLTRILRKPPLEIAEAVCDRIAIIQKGKIITVGTLAEVRSQTESHGQSLEQLFLKLTGGAELRSLEGVFGD